MCGINGIFSYRDSASAPDQAECIAVRDAMRSRGPDGEGFFREPSGRCLLGHRRLAIIDLTDSAAQPMTSSDGRLTVTFNGEIYNYRSLRAELERGGARFRTNSDTEVVLQMFDRHGPQMVSKLRGMFALAIWDSAGRTLFLARDPHGIKPLYYADDGSCFRFASSVRALALSNVSRDLNPRAIVAFLGWGSVPEPLTMYESMRTLPAGSTLQVNADGAGQVECYWRPADAYATQCEPLGPVELERLVRQHVAESVKAHLVADVPVGVFLSSGIDSSVLLGLASESHREPIRAVTLAFDEFRGTPHDEVPLAVEVARQFGARHSTIRLSAQSVHASMTDFITAMDQPSVDGLNVYWISLAARESGLKAVLSGLGADELFGGYRSFGLFANLRRLSLARHIPGMIQGTELIGRMSPTRHGPKLQALGEGLSSPGATFQLIRGLFTSNQVRSLVHRDIWDAAQGTDAILWPARRAIDELNMDLWSQIAIAEQSVYMRNQLLRDADWASMKHSLELRVPFVDRVLTDTLAPRMAKWGRSAKAILAKAVTKRLPDKLVRRQKTGFALPMQEWVSTDIRAARLRAPPATILCTHGMREFERLSQGVTRGRVHWSRVWGLHCLARWLERST